MRLEEISQQMQFILKDGNLFDPFNGKDLESGLANFIGRPDEQIRRLS